MKCRSSTTVGFRVFRKEGGSPLPVNSGVLDLSDFDVDTTRETLVKNDPKCRRVCFKIVWHEWTRCHTILKQSLRQPTQLFLKMFDNLETFRFLKWSFPFLFCHWYFGKCVPKLYPKFAVTHFWNKQTLVCYATWRTQKERLSRSIQTTFLGPKRVYILGHFWPKFHG